MNKFSLRFKSFKEWLNAKARNTEYAKRVIKLHELAPSLSLKELLEQGISHLSPALKSWKELSAEERDLRIRALQTLSDMRKGESLTKAAKEQGITRKQAVMHLGRYVYKKKGRWVATHTDKIERGRWFYSDGERISVIINDSGDASLISNYLNAVRWALDTGDKSILQSFKGLKITDVDGEKHCFRN
ncbi:hypothetical protein J7W08_04810 [Methanococcoides orientis]|uniref:hypothetical protein n=1 Tax=Methanococcoides orientis TaxID=2822137 RepID=UPI001E643ACB|nr:hypothetical protein [Methanococcoides orientis]UGV41610.1 hypothetical protein J7W08_04810 [Methanococcoides orientis]